MSFSHPAANSVRFFCFCVWLPSFLTSAYILCLLGQPSGESRTQSSIPNSRRSYRLIAAVPLDETLITPPLIVWSIPPQSDEALPSVGPVFAGTASSQHASHLQRSRLTDLNRWHRFPLNMDESENWAEG